MHRLPKVIEAMLPTTDERRPSTRPDWVRGAVSLPILLGSICAVMLFRLIRRRPTEKQCDDSLTAIRRSTLGRSTDQIRRQFGPPTAAADSPRLTWYYPVDAQRQTAMAIEFDNDRAVAVDFFQSGSGRP